MGEEVSKKGETEGRKNTPDRVVTWTDYYFFASLILVDLCPARVAPQKGLPALDCWFFLRAIDMLCLTDIQLELLVLFYHFKSNKTLYSS